MYSIEYRIYKDANYYQGWSQHSEMHVWTPWRLLKTTKKDSAITKDGKFQSDNLLVLEGLKQFLHRKQLKQAVKREYRIIKIEEKNEIS